jgi:hypothetical protein
MVTESIRNSSEPQFNDFEGVLQSFADGELRINKIQEISQGKVVRIETNPDTWISVTHRNDDGTYNMTIGEQKLPANIERQWKWGTKTAEGQFVVKTSHEYAHVVQNAYDEILLKWLDNRIDKVPEWSEVYLRLYSALSETGPVNGLAAMGFYHERSVGNLHAPTHEDIAELIGAYMIGDEYFDFRIKNANVLLSDDTQKEIKVLVESIVTHYISSLSESH